jgi:outer membrane lipoprotein SlyB
MRPRALALLAFTAALSSACVTTTTTATTWGDPGVEGGWARPGRVERIREVVQRQQGDPGAGAVAGAILGGLFGSAIGGPYHANGAAAFAGAMGGAMIGAAASASATGETRSYEVLVRFDDGGAETFVYRDALPFQVGEPVQLTPQGLVRG